MKQIVLATVACLALTACGGGDGSSAVSTSVTPPAPTGTVTPAPAPAPTPTPAPEPTTVSTTLTSADSARDFLMRSSWGGTQSEIDALVGTDAADWLRREMDKPPVEVVPALEAGGEFAQGGSAHLQVWYDRMLLNDDDLRTRMVFALSQIMVASRNDINDRTSGSGLAAYADTLDRHAFGNYRDLLEEVTYNPAMGRFLTYWRNEKESDDGLRQPDENYAREIMQLFSIGLVELNMDGTPKLDAQGVPLETYTNEDVSGLARVFTGFGYPGLTSNNWTASGGSSVYGPMEVYDRWHEDGEKTFLGTTIPAGTDGPTSVSQAMDAIFEHPNVAPFVATRLIQRFTQSTPAPDYVERVARAFETGTFTTASGQQFGTTGRGDLEATLAAILLDSQFFDDRPPGPRDGKIREPFLRWAHWANALDVENKQGSNEWAIFRSMASLSHGPFQSPSVFNFYRSGYKAPGSASADAGLVAPELQLIDESAIRQYGDYMFRFVNDSTTRLNSDIDTFIATYPNLTPLATDPVALVDALDDLMVSGNFEPTTRQRMIDALNLVTIRDDNVEADMLGRARLATYMTVTSVEYGMQY